MPSGAFGPAIVFGTSPSGLVPVELWEKRMSSRWAKHEIHLGMPLPEFMGPDLTEIDTEMCFISPYTTEPQTAIELLEFYLNLSAPQFLILGAVPVGRGMSQFVVKEISETYRIIEANGRVTSARVRVKLMEYPSSLSNNLLFNTAIQTLGSFL